MEAVRMFRRRAYPRFQVDIDAICMGLIYVLGTVVILLVVIYAWERFG